MTARLDKLQAALQSALGDKIQAFKRERGEITITVSSADYLTVARQLRDNPELKFEQLVDLCGLDYSSYKDRPWDGPRFCIVSHLLSVSLNWRVRLKVLRPTTACRWWPRSPSCGRPLTGSSARPSTWWA